MSDRPPRTHNLPDLAEVVHPETIAALIEEALAASPTSADGEKVLSLRDRDRQLVQMCERFLRAYPRITSEDGARIATDVLGTCQKFTSGSGRIETARTAFKAPILAAGRQIDDAFAKLGTLLVVRPLTGPVRGRRIAPLTLAEQVAERLILFTEEQDRKKREAAEAEVTRLEEQARIARDLAAKGSTVVSAEDVALAESEAAKQRRTAAAPMNELTRTAGNMTGSTSGKRVRTFEITDPKLVPREYCSPDERLLRAGVGAADSPIPNIPGVVIRDQTDLNRR